MHGNPPQAQPHNVDHGRADPRFRRVDRPNQPDDVFIERLYATRSVLATARDLGLSEHDALKRTMMAFGLGKVDFRLQDF